MEKRKNYIHINFTKLWKDTLQRYLIFTNPRRERDQILGSLIPWIWRRSFFISCYRCQNDNSSPLPCVRIRTQTLF